MSAVTKFRGDFYFLSNRSNYPLDFFGLEYDRSENAFQAMKCDNIKLRSSFQHLPFKEVKHKGRQVHMRKDWDKISYTVMINILLCKFVQNDDIRRLLFRTGESPLIEGNNWGDTTWGVVNGIGLNKMGKALMEVRSILKQSLNPKYIYDSTLNIVIIKLNSNEGYLMSDESSLEKIELLGTKWCDSSGEELLDMIGDLLC